MCAKIIHRSVKLGECEIYGVIRHFDAVLLVTSRGCLLCYGGCEKSAAMMFSRDWINDYRCRLATNASVGVSAGVDTNEVLAQMFIAYDSVPVMFEGRVEFQCTRNVGGDYTGYDKLRAARNNHTIIPNMRPDFVDSRHHEYMIRGHELLIVPRNNAVYFHSINAQVRPVLALKYHSLCQIITPIEIAMLIADLMVHLYRVQIHEHRTLDIES